MTDEDFNRVVTRIRTDNKLDTDEAFHAALKQEGMTMADLRTSLEKQMLVTRVQQAEVMGKISITEEEARKYHAEHVQEFTPPRRGDDSRDPAGRAEERQGLQRRPRRRGQGQGRGGAQADRRRRGVRAGGRRGVDLALASQRRPGRAAQPGRVDAGVSGAAQGTQARRRQRRHQDAGRLSDREARIADGRHGAVGRRSARPDRRCDLRAEAPGRVQEVPGEAAGAGDHRVEERGNQEGVAVESRRCRRRSRPPPRRRSPPTN